MSRYMRLLPALLAVIVLVTTLSAVRPEAVAAPRSDVAASQTRETAAPAVAGVSAAAAASTDTDAFCGYLGGVVDTDMTLVTGCSYSVVSNVSVASGSSLFIEPGVSILFDGEFYLQVEGTLEAQGTPENSILFSSNSQPPSPGDWAGLHLIGQTPSVISHAVIEYGGAWSPIREGVVYLDGGAHVVEHSEIRLNTGRGIVLDDGDGVVRDSAIHDNNELSAVVDSIGRAGESQLIDNSFLANSAGSVIGISGEKACILQGNLFEGNVAGGDGVVSVQDNEAQVEIAGNLFVGNSMNLPPTWAGIIWLGGGGDNTTLSCNVFQGNVIDYDSPPEPGTYAATVFIVYAAPAELSQNAFLPVPDQYDIAVSGQVDDDVDATDNYWDTTDPLEVAQRIYDHFDDLDLVEVITEPTLAAWAECLPPGTPDVDFSSSSPDWLGQITVFTNTTTVIPPNHPTLEYLWSFGDGLTSRVTDPVHAYAEPGRYTVTLTATNASGIDVASGAVTAYGPPAVDFKASPTEGQVPLTVAFTDSTTTIPPGDSTLAHSWTFDDGGTSTLANPTHVYAAAGVYTVTLEVENAAGIDSYTRYGYIHALPAFRVYLPLVLRGS